MKPLILLTNDDGVFSPGLAAVAAAVRPFGELLVVAPRFQQTTMGRAFPHHAQTGRIEELEIMAGDLQTVAYAVEGSPAQAVAHAILELADRKPVLCISGINYGANIGLALTCSGTLGAAFEADSHGIPTIAISRQTPLHWQRAADYPATDWSAAQKCLIKVVESVLTEGFPCNTPILNINVPDQPANPLQVRLTRQSRFNDSVFVQPGVRDRGCPFQLATRLNTDYNLLDQDSDAYALYVERAISVTPLTWDMTAVTWAGDSGLQQIWLC